MPVIPTPEVAIPEMIRKQDQIDGLQRIINRDPSALGIRSKIQKQQERLKREIIELAYDHLPD